MAHCANQVSQKIMEKATWGEVIITEMYERYVIMV